MDPRIDKHLNSNIKDLINEFDGIQQALDKFEIGCAPCSLGTCKLKDVVGIHNLNAENEKELISQIFKIIYPDEIFDIPRIAQEKKNTGNTMSPPLRMLVNEHILIKRVLALAPKITEILDFSIPEHKMLILDIVDFIRSYADKYHHSKEEDILFKYFDSSLDIIKVMISDHVQSRSYVTEMFNAVETGNTLIAKNNLIYYCDLLTEHINKEDTILYPWMDNNLDTKQVGKMYSEFLSINNSKPEIQGKYEAIVNSFENFKL